MLNLPVPGDNTDVFSGLKQETCCQRQQKQACEFEENKTRITKYANLMQTLLLRYENEPLELVHLIISHRVPVFLLQVSLDC